MSAFSAALLAAQSHGLACLGGQFQFRLAEGTYEMYWLNAESTEKRSGETWAGYSNRSCSEVLDRFNDLVSKTDFAQEAAGWKLQESAVEDLVFVAYFETETSLAELEVSKKK